MRVKYRDCEIEVTREKSLGGWYTLYYSIYDEDDFEVTCGFTDGNDTVRDYIKYMKRIVDDYRENPQDYYDGDVDFTSDSEWAKSLDYGGYNTEEEFWEHVYKY